MTDQPVPTQSVIDSFLAIGVPAHELRVLALGIDFDAEIVPEDQVILLRDSWRRIQRGENRIAAFWWVNGTEKPLDGQEELF